MYQTGERDFLKENIVAAGSVIKDARRSLALRTSIRCKLALRPTITPPSAPTLVR